MRCAALAILLSAPAWSEPPPTREAYMVIGPGSQKEADGARLLRDARKIMGSYTVLGTGESVDLRARFPMWLESAKVNGLKPGFWVMVLAAPAQEATARRLVQLYGKGTYYRRVEIEQPEDLVVWLSRNGGVILGTAEAAKNEKADLETDVLVQRAAIRKRLAAEQDAAREDCLRRHDDWEFQRKSPHCDDHCDGPPEPICD